MPPTRAVSIAVLLHLAHTRHLEEFSAALNGMGQPFDLFVNLVEGINTDKQIRQQQADILARYPDATILLSENRGMDTGGMFRLFEQVRTAPYQALLYAHSKSSDTWRQRMLRSLTGNAQTLTNALRASGPEKKTASPGMIGCYSYPFDYYNIGPFLTLMSELAIPLNTSWEPYYRHYPMTRELDLAQRIAHANDQARLYGKRSDLRPEIDLDYVRQLLGDPHAAEQSMTPRHLKRLIADQVMGPLPYFPGNFFWISPGVIRALAKHLDFEKEYASLPLDLVSDRQSQSRAHAWERALPVFALKNGFSLMTSSRAGN